MNTEPEETTEVPEQPVSTAEEAVAAEAIETVTTRISYDDFAKLEITIGEIKAVEIVENADKLLRLSVDVGEAELRQIISGIRTYFADPQELVGVKCPFLTNLEPRVIRGFESQGMILAANHTDTFALLQPHQDLPAGTKIK